MCFVSVGWLESHVFCFCRVVAGKPCVLFLLGGGWKAMRFVSVEWWLESHVFCFCRVAGKPCVLFL